MIIKNRKNKKGLSVIIGYVLLMAVSIFMSIMVYRWIKTYVPKDIESCPGGTSISIKEINYSCPDNPAENQIINITLKNNGRFSLDGYFIRASNDTSSESLANIDLVPKFIEPNDVERAKIVLGNQIKFHVSQDNSFSPGAITAQVYSFDVNDYRENHIQSIEIIPIRRLVVDNKKRVAICSDAKIKEQIICSTD